MKYTGFLAGILLLMIILTCGCSKDDIAGKQNPTSDPENNPSVDLMTETPTPANTDYSDRDIRNYENQLSTEYEQTAFGQPSDKIKVAQISDFKEDNVRTLIYVADFPYNCNPKLIRIGCSENVRLLNKRDLTDGIYSISYYKLYGDYSDISSINATEKDGVHTVAIVRLDLEGTEVDESSIRFIFYDDSENITCSENIEAAELDVINRAYVRSGIINIGGRYYFYYESSNYNNDTQAIELRTEYLMKSFDGNYPRYRDLNDYEFYLSQYTFSDSDDEAYASPVLFEDKNLMEIQSVYAKSDQKAKLVMNIYKGDSENPYITDSNANNSYTVPILLIKNPDGTYAGLIKQ